MSTTAMNSAASGLTALNQRLEVIANNLANVNTVGFKRSRTNFEDVMYQIRRQPGAENSLGDKSPTGVEVGLGVKLSGTQLMMEQGSPETTNRELDLMVDGDGFFQVRIFDEMGPNGIGYTRAGNFFRNADGQLVLGNANGFRMEPEITIPDNASSITIGSDGSVLVTTPDATEPQEVGQIQLASFTNPEGLLAKGQNVYVETAASGPPTQGNPTESGLGSIQQNALEASNVEPTFELITMIQTQRSFELNSQTIKTAAAMQQVITQLRS